MIEKSWEKELSSFLETPQFKKLIEEVKNEYEKNTVYPKYENLFRAYSLTPYNKVKVVIIGQDPYHGEGEANGLAFSVYKNTKVPPSLRNIFKELETDLNIKNTHGDLTKWAKRGVLLINSHLTVEKDEPASHKHIKWEIFTEEVIKSLNKKNTPVVFILWGNFALKYKGRITNNKHLILTSSHPSPFSARISFFGSEVFSKTNQFLKENKIKEVDFNN